MTRRTRSRTYGAMPLFDEDRPEPLSEEVRQAVVDVLADLLLEALVPDSRKDGSDEPEDRA